MPKNKRMRFTDPMKHMQPAVDKLIDDIGTRILITLSQYRPAGNRTQMRVTVRTLLRRFIGIYSLLPHGDDTLVMTDKSIEGCFLTAIKFLINDGFIKIVPPAVQSEFEDNVIVDYHESAVPDFRAERFRE